MQRKRHLSGHVRSGQHQEPFACIYLPRCCESAKASNDPIAAPVVVDPPRLDHGQQRPFPSEQTTNKTTTNHGSFVPALVNTPHETPSYPDTLQVFIATPTPRSHFPPSRANAPRWHAALHLPSSNNNRQPTTNNQQKSATPAYVLLLYAFLT